MSWSAVLQRLVAVDFYLGHHWRLVVTRGHMLVPSFGLGEQVGCFGLGLGCQLVWLSFVLARLTRLDVVRGR